MQFQSWIRQSNAYSIERRTYPSNKNSLKIRPRDNEATDQDLVAGKDPHSRGNVEQGRRCCWSKVKFRASERRSVAASSCNEHCSVGQQGGRVTTACRIEAAS